MIAPGAGVGRTKKPKVVRHPPTMWRGGTTISPGCAYRHRPVGTCCSGIVRFVWLRVHLSGLVSPVGCTTSPHGWRVPNHLRLLRAPYTRAWNDHRSLDWRKSACCSPGAVAAQRARGSKHSHGGVPRVYPYGHISHGRRGRERTLKAVSACSMKNISKVIALEFPGWVR